MDVMEAIRTRRSIRSYDSRPIPDDVMERMLDALRLAPSACNRQPWQFVIVTDEGVRQQLGEAAGGQMFIAEAPVIVVGVGYPEKAFKFMGDTGNSVDVDLAIALDHLTLAAAADGLGTCWIGAFIETKAKEILNVPADAKIVAMTPLGYPTEAAARKDRTSRKAPKDIFVDNKF